MCLRDTSMEVQNFLETNFDDCDLEYIKNEIMQTDIKNALKVCGNSIPKFRLKIYAYLFDELFCFPPQTNYDIITTKTFFNHVHNQITQRSIFIILISQAKSKDMRMTFAIEKLLS